MKEKETKITRNRRIENMRRRKNAKLYPLYKMFSWDLLCFYSIEFLFYTITKQITAAQVLIASGLYMIFKVLMYIPAVVFTDLLGRKKGIVFGNISLILCLLVMIVLPGFGSIVLSNLIFALGYNIKTIAESSLLCDSVSTRGGDGLYSKLDSRGGSLYYIFDGICSLVAGYLFVINNYLPVFICMGFIVIATIISFNFKDIYISKNKEKTDLKVFAKEYTSDLKQSIKFMLKSKRMKSFMIFSGVLSGLIGIIGTCRSDLLVDLNVNPEQFSIIFAIITMIGGISISLRSRLEKKLKNRSLSFIAFMYLATCIIVGGISVYFSNLSLIIPIILLMYVIQNMCTSNWYILDAKYIKNFTSPEKRDQVTFLHNFVGSIIASILAVIGGLILDYAGAAKTFLLVGFMFLAIMILVLDYMKTRFGLRPEQYKKEDIEF